MTCIQKSQVAQEVNRLRKDLQIAKREKDEVGMKCHDYARLG